MGAKISFARFRPYIAILSIAALTWSAMFFAIGYPYWKMILITAIGIAISPLIWQAFGVYKIKLKSQEGLENGEVYQKIEKFSKWRKELIIFKRTWNSFCCCCWDRYCSSWLCR